MTHRLTVLVVVTVMLLAAGVPALAQQSIDGWPEMRRDMEMFKGAIDRTLASTVLNTYIPDYGVVFLFTVKHGVELDDARRDIEKALTFITPTISELGPDERIAISGFSDGFVEQWELLYIATRESSADPDTWEIYHNSTR